MGATKELRTGIAPTTISPGVVSLYASASNVILSVISGGAPVVVGGTFTGSYATAAIATGMGQVSTGFWFGQGSNSLTSTGLGPPAAWLSIQFAGTGYAIPAYAFR